MSVSNWYHIGKSHRDDMLINKQGVRADESIEKEYFLLKKNYPVRPRLYNTIFLGSICAEADEVELFAKRMSEKHANVSHDYYEETNTHEFHSVVKNENFQEEVKVHNKRLAEHEVALRKFSEYEEVTTYVKI